MIGKLLALVVHKDCRINPAFLLKAPSSTCPSLLSYIHFPWLKPGALHQVSLCPVWVLTEFMRHTQNIRRTSSLSVVILGYGQTLVNAQALPLGHRCHSAGICIFWYSPPTQSMGPRDPKCDNLTGLMQGCFPLGRLCGYNMVTST